MYLTCYFHFVTVSKIYFCFELHCLCNNFYITTKYLFSISGFKWVCRRTKNSLLKTLLTQCFQYVHRLGTPKYNRTNLYINVQWDLYILNTPRFKLVAPSTFTLHYNRTLMWIKIHHVLARLRVVSDTSNVDWNSNRLDIQADQLNRYISQEIYQR